MTQHAGLSLERWKSFTPEQRILMVANEMNRVSSSMSPEHEESRRLGYERVLNLADLTAQAADRLAMRKELSRWRGLVADLYLSAPNPEAHEATLRALLQLTPAGAVQLRALAELRAQTPE